MTFFILGGVINFFVPPHQKLVPAIPDPSLMLPVGAQSFPESMLMIVGYVVPLVAIFAVARALDKTDFCISALALTQCVGLAMFTTTVAKKMAGRPRPCFYAMCGWVSNSTEIGGGHCTAPMLRQWEARQSFPSGHSSFSMAGLAFLGMYLLEKSDQLQRPPRMLTALQLQGIQLGALAPFALALWVAISRTTDYWHHYSDVLAGSVWGFAVASHSFGQRARLRAMADDRHADATKRAARVSDGAAESVDDPMLPTSALRDDEIREVV